MVEMLKTKTNLIVKIVSYSCLFLFLFNYFDGLYSAYNLGNLELSNYLNYTVKIFQNEIFFFLTLLLFFKFNPYVLLILLPISSYEQNHNSFYNIHSLLLNNGFYDLITNTPLDISPEYPRIIFFISVLILYLIKSLLLKRGGIERYFLSISCVACITTVIIFHIVVISEINLYRDISGSNIKRSIYTLNSERSLVTFCKNLDYKCYWFSNVNEKEEFINGSALPTEVKEYIPVIKNEIETNEYFYFNAIATDFSAKNRILAQSPVYFMKNPELIMVIIDNVGYKKVLVKNQFIFGILSMLAQSVWFFGALYLIYFHKKKKNIKLVV